MVKLRTGTLRTIISQQGFQNKNFWKINGSLGGAAKIQAVGRANVSFVVLLERRLGQNRRGQALLVIIVVAKDVEFI